MRTLRRLLLVGCTLLGMASMVSLSSCGDDDDGGNDALDRGVGDACASADDCLEEGQQCLTQFKGGYCGIADCQNDDDCPIGSACVAHDDGNQYCFLICSDKSQCNHYRPADAEANCSSSVTFTDGAKGSKACLPPSG